MASDMLERKALVGLKSVRQAVPAGQGANRVPVKALHDGHLPLVDFS